MPLDATAAVLPLGYYSKLHVNLGWTNLGISINIWSMNLIIGVSKICFYKESGPFFFFSQFFFSSLSSKRANEQTKKKRDVRKKRKKKKCTVYSLNPTIQTNQSSLFSMTLKTNQVQVNNDSSNERKKQRIRLCLMQL